MRNVFVLIISLFLLTGCSFKSDPIRSALKKDDFLRSIIKYKDKYGPILIEQYANPLTQILMLTAIVVGVATLGLGLTLARKVYDNYDTFNEDEILQKIKEEND